MTRDPKYDILFEPVQIGPVTTRNRFYQVPHCNGLGHGRPSSEAASRRVKAEGGWGVICTQEAEIHPSTDVSPFYEGRLWDDRDIPQHRLMTDAVHEHGSLAGIELTYAGLHASNRYSRVAPMSPSEIPGHTDYPIQARAMTKKDIANVRRWHVEAAKRSKAAGYDIVYVYAGHDLSVLQHFMKPAYNRRSDEYGGSLENRVRLAREVLIDVREAVGDSCAVAFRFAVDELLGEEGMQAKEEGRAVVELLAEYPDLWDVNVSDWQNDSAGARFEPVEGFQESYISFVKQVTSKPVVGVGRFTSADAMVSQIKRGVLDLIGAARPSIADPFLPNKINEGRIEDIRECIGCNICVAQDNLASPIRCTQNPTQGEEWKQNWHPEKIEAAKGDEPVLVVGAGPAGLECAMQLANRGYEVMLAEAEEELGGRVLRESSLPGLASYIRVKDYREGQLVKKPNVQIFRDNRLSAEDVLALEIPHVFIATGASWRRDGMGLNHHYPIDGIDSCNVFTADDIMAGNMPAGRVLVYDDDHYYMGGVVAEACRQQGLEVTLVTPESLVSSWTQYTLEQNFILKKLLEMGVNIVTLHEMLSAAPGRAVFASVYTEKLQQTIEFDSLVMVTSRLSSTQLFDALVDSAYEFRTLQAIGDCFAAGTVAAATYHGHSAARYFEADHDEYEPLFRREIPLIETA